MSRRSRALIVIALVTGVVAADGPDAPRHADASRPDAAPARLPREKSVAVLPFANASGHPSDQASCDGLLVVVISGLARLSETRERVWVVPVSDVREQRIATATEARRAVGGQPRVLRSGREARRPCDPLARACRHAHGPNAPVRTDRRRDVRSRDLPGRSRRRVRAHARHRCGAPRAGSARGCEDRLPHRCLRRVPARPRTPPAVRPGRRASTRPSGCSSVRSRPIRTIPRRTRRWARRAGASARRRGTRCGSGARPRAARGRSSSTAISRRRA